MPRAAARAGDVRRSETPAHETLRALREATAKEDLRQFWEQPDRRTAERFLKDWCARAEASGIRILQTFANTLRGHRNGLLAWYAEPISTGPLEGVNNKIKLLQRRAYGYRDLELFKLRILSLHTTRYEIVG